MQFEGEHLLPGNIGQFFVLLAFVASIISTIAYFIAAKKTDLVQKRSWLNFARVAFTTQLISAIIIFVLIFYICANHYFEYMYAYKHASKELEPKYLLACIWEGQEGSFLLWVIWHSILGVFIMFKSKEWEAPVMTVISLAQFFLLMMLLGFYVGDIRLGSSPFTLTRNEIAGPIFSQPDYLTFIKDGVGLNVLLRNYWMVIHPPVLFLGFASTIIPFAYAYAGIQTKRFGDWVTPALPWALLSACVLGVGIMMGGKWAYESLSFGGYWAWDPVENASLVPWLILIAGLHTMVIFKATGHSLKSSYLFAFLTFIFILYSTFLTRTGVLGDTSVHAFTDAGKAINIMILLFVAAFTLPSIGLLISNLKNIPTIQKEESTNSREFWMFIGSLVFFLAAIFIIAKTSVPVYNKIFGTSIAQPEDVEFSYNKVIVMVAIIIGLLSAVTQYFKYKKTESNYILKKIAVPTFIAAIITILLAVFYPLTYYKGGAGFLGAVYIALFAAIYSVLANGMYIWTGLNGKLKAAGGSIAHLGFALMLAGILISSSNKKIISSSSANGINLQISGKDPMTKQTDNPLENLTLIRQVPATMGQYEVTYLRDSFGNEKGRRFYELLFQRKEAGTKKVLEQFTLWPDVYIMKDNNMSSNPDTKTYLTKDVFTFISYAINNDAIEDTAQFAIKEMAEGDTAFYSNGIIILNSVVKNPVNEKYNFKPTDAALMADITLISKDSLHFKAMPLIQVDGIGVNQVDDTVYAQNLYVKFAGVTDGRKIKLGIKESDKLIQYVTLKAYVFPYINLVWLGLIIMALGIIMSAVKRAKLSTFYAALALLLGAAGLFYMFLFAN
ncbi:MAG: cytochrome c biogenesis protein CcsA [Chitinophagaceae bacterium]|nr:cytochrome c biogenesis protein CcsA [Chitinophagaceae bacterium]MBK9484988.1 cytochrome c biogenesis protein CcsA [Chitinophagaceae bacterium]